MRNATNYDSTATIDNGSWVQPGSICPSGVASAECPGANSNCPGDFTGDGYIGVDDILSMLSLFNTSCYPMTNGILKIDSCVGTCLTAFGQSEYIWRVPFGMMNCKDASSQPWRHQLTDASSSRSPRPLTAWELKRAWQCGDPLEYQGYDYATVLIGEQCWFAENLRSERVIWKPQRQPWTLKRCIWWLRRRWVATITHQTTMPCPRYGRLYNWYAVDDARSLCVQAAGTFIRTVG